MFAALAPPPDARRPQLVVAAAPPHFPAAPPPHAPTQPRPRATPPHLAPHPPAPTQRLASGEWFTSRISSCGLFTVAYARAPAAARGDLRQLYAALCRDETPMVRRAAAQRLGTFAGAVEKELVAKELLPLFTELTADGGAQGAGRWRRGWRGGRGGGLLGLVEATGRGAWDGGHA